MNRRFIFIALPALALLAGCASDRPHDYGDQRPPVDSISGGDSGLQSKDVVAASDQMAQDLLALPELNRSQNRWTIVVDHVQNETTDRRFDLDIFLERLKGNLSKYGHDRVALIENKRNYHGLQSNELEGEREGDQYQQGDSQGVNKPTYRGIQPDYSLYAKIIEMPNRGTSYFLCSFSLVDFHTREDVWNRDYEVKTDR
jgi:Peptidoglycan-synthase activator LpoB